MVQAVDQTKLMADQAPLVLHVIYRLAMGGLENGLVNLINRMPVHQYRHMIVCVTDFTDFRDRIIRDDIKVVAIHKKSGIDWRSYVRMWKVIKQFKPTLLHTRNLPTLEYAIVAALAGVPYRLHGEHGRDVHDQYGASPKFRVFRRIVAWWIHHFMTVSRDLSSWLHESIGIDRGRISQLYNGVDTQRFYPRQGEKRDILPQDFSSSDRFIVGTVGRMQTVKDQITLVRAFLHLVTQFPESAERVRLVLVGDGPHRPSIEALLDEAGSAHLVWMPGERSDIPELLRSFDLFVLPSQAEGISNTILEAMASGLPILATAVGGNLELVVDGETGSFVPSQDPRAMAEAMNRYVRDLPLAREHGRAGRVLAESRYSLDSMVNSYVSMYDALLGKTLTHEHRS